LLDGGFKYLGLSGCDRALNEFETRGQTRPL